ncbi:MAG: hypothetical protein ACYCTB_11030 [bacterium]
MTYKEFKKKINEQSINFIDNDGVKKIFKIFNVRRPIKELFCFDVYIDRKEREIRISHDIDEFIDIYNGLTGDAAIYISEYGFLNIYTF